jgi:hypothetical protein
MTQSALSSATSWVEGTLLGAFATSIAVIAVASIGFLMLTGRIDVRRTVQVILGCFIMFGASTIANGLMVAISGADEGPSIAQVAPSPSPQLPAPGVSQRNNSTPFDPYAGAAIQ